MTIETRIVLAACALVLSSSLMLLVRALDGSWFTQALVWLFAVKWMFVAIIGEKVGIDATED